MKFIITLFVILMHLVSSFRNQIGIFTFAKLKVNKVNCRVLYDSSIEPFKQMTESDDRLTLCSRLSTTVKLPTRDRSIVESFLEDSDYIVESVWDKLKTKKVSPYTYNLQLSVIPVPGLSIINPEVKVEVSSHRSSLYVNCLNWGFKDGCGRVMTIPVLGSLDLHLSGKLRILSFQELNSDNDGEEKRKLGPMKSVIVGPQVHLEASAEYNITGIEPDLVKQLPSTLNQVTNLLHDRFNDFMQHRVPSRLVKAFKAYAASAIQSKNSW